MKYKVYYMNVYKRSFSTRDEAVQWIHTHVMNAGGRYQFEDYEILDGSDSL